ncbi:MAG: ABC transporter ATP-binding protein [Chloroflexi bacterium]|nr:ABC transporter ATP-binding protein [Chloroflexota bacterium]MCI0643286.1 ABC transporter ATP-binding protein [Chloroflexota bacterium]MCI0731673.1 ABC transporter ATP-binding protein [Chloroflexota bacterium]
MVSRLAGQGGRGKLSGRMIVYDVQQVTKIYPGQARPANREISLQIQQGEIFGILGDNGAGKSTLVRQMVNLLASSAGRITLFGREVGQDPTQVTVNVGYMPQDALALNNLTVGEAIYFTAHLRGLGRAEARREQARLLELWQMGPLRDKYTPRLSGGQRRLLRLAVALAGSPPVLILDEPTNDLDPQRRKLVWEVLRRLNQEEGTTILFITHDALEAEKIIQRVGIMRDGELVALGRPAELKQSLDRKLRLELFFPPERPPALPPGVSYRPLESGRWLALLEVGEITAVLNHLDLAQLDDFRLYSTTLEDLYLHYASRP